MSTAPQPSQEPSELYLLGLQEHWGVKTHALAALGRTLNSLRAWREDPEFRQREEEILLQVKQRQKTLVVDAISSGMGVESAAEQAHVTRQTVKKWIDEDPEFANDVLIAKDKREELLSQGS